MGSNEKYGSRRNCMGDDPRKNKLKIDLFSPVVVQYIACYIGDYPSSVVTPNFSWVFAQILRLFPNACGVEPSKCPVALPLNVTVTNEDISTCFCRLKIKL